MEQKIKAREKFQTPILKEKTQRLWNIKKIGGNASYGGSLFVTLWTFWGENPLRCTTQDEKGLVLTTILFYPIF